MLRRVNDTTKAAVLGLVLGVLALGPALGSGFVLLQDMVFVPDPSFSLFTFGLSGGAPRAVPSDAVVTLLAAVVPAELVQKAILLGIFVLGCSGAAALMPSGQLVPKLVAGAFYVWNPYVAERLLMGQWALLLGYAGLPWVVRAVCARRLVALALLPAAVGGFAAMAISAITALPVAAFMGYGKRQVAKVGAILLVLSLPWLVPTLLRPSGLTGDPTGVDAFAARADGPFGAIGSLLALGGIWNANAVPVGYDTMIGAVARLAIAIAGIAGFWLAAKSRTLSLPYPRGLVVAAVVGFGIACIGVTEVGRNGLKGLIGVWGGFAVLRDAQQFIAPLVLLVAVGLGMLTARVASRWSVLVLIVPLAAVPTLAWGAFGALEAVPYPKSWTAARALIAQDPEPGDVLVLPFESYRRYPWNGHRAVLDPAHRYFAIEGRQVIVNDTVRVGALTVGTEDPRAREIGGVLGAPSPNLAAAGVRYVVVDAGTSEERLRFSRWLAGADLVLTEPDLRLYRFGEPSP